MINGLQWNSLESGLFFAFPCPRSEIPFEGHRVASQGGVSAWIVRGLSTLLLGVVLEHFGRGSGHKGQALRTSRIWTGRRMEPIAGGVAPNRTSLSCPGSSPSPGVPASRLPVSQHISLVAQPDLVPPDTHSSHGPLRLRVWEEATRRALSFKLPALGSCLRPAAPPASPVPNHFHLPH